jgi:hypothetical protein
MSRRISQEGKDARALIARVNKETERLIDKVVVKAGIRLKPESLRVQVALNLGLTESQVAPIVQAYIWTRADLYLTPGKAGGIAHHQ